MTLSASTALNRLLSRGKFRQLQVLLKIAELGSVQRSAEAIGMTQSAVTQTIAYLERLLETQLFERHARGMRPTAVCLGLLPVARQISERLKDCAEVIATHQRGSKSLVRLTASTTAVNGLLDHTLPAFNVASPDIQIQITEAEGDDQLLAISHGETDLIACREPSTIPEGWKFIPLVPDRFAIICTASNSLAQKGNLKWKDLRKEKWLLLPLGPARDHFEKIVSRIGSPPLIYPAITRSPTLIATLMREGNLLGVLPLTFATPHLASGLMAELPLKPAMPIAPLGILRPESTLGSGAARFLDFLQRRIGSV